MSDRPRLPSGGLAAICGWLHSQLCYDARGEQHEGECGHTWRDHSGGRPYQESAHRLTSALADRGLMIARIPDGGTR